MPWVIGFAGTRAGCFKEIPNETAEAASINDRTRIRNFMVTPFSFGLTMWTVGILLAGVLAVRSGQLKGRLPAFRFYLLGVFFGQFIMLPTYLCCNTFYGPYWYALNAYQAVETFLLTVILGELFHEARRAVIPGVLLALGAATPLGEIPTLSMSVLCVVAGICAFLEDERGSVAQGILVMLFFPMISGHEWAPRWLASVSTVSAIMAQGLWLYGISIETQMAPSRGHREI